VKSCAGRILSVSEMSKGAEGAGGWESTTSFSSQTLLLWMGLYVVLILTRLIGKIGHFKALTHWTL